MVTDSLTHSHTINLEMLLHLKREENVKMFDLYGVMGDMEGPNTSEDDVRGIQ